MRVLVTGGSGFIGRHLVKKLTDEGHEVSILNRTSYVGTDSSAFDYCFHLGSTTHNYHILDNPKYDFENNCLKLIDLLEVLRVTSPKCKHVYISTFFVNDGAPKGLYGASKLAAEHILQVYKNVYDLEYCVLRLPNVYGPGEKGSSKKGSLNWMIERAVHREPLEFYGGNARREFLYIDDAIGEIWDNRDDFGVLNIPGYAMKMRDFIYLIQFSATESDTMPDFHRRVGLGDYCSYEVFRGKILPEEGIKRTKEYYARLHTIQGE